MGFPRIVCTSLIKDGKATERSFTTHFTEAVKQKWTEICAVCAARSFANYVGDVTVMFAISHDAIALPRPLLWQLGDLAVLSEYYDLRRNTSPVIRGNITIILSKTTRKSSKYRAAA